MIKILNFILTFLRNTNPVFVTAFAAASAVATVWQLFTSLWQQLFARLDQLVVGALGTSASFAPLGLIDAIFPLTELLNFLTAYALLRLVCASVRIIKSFIPTIS